MSVTPGTAEVKAPELKCDGSKLNVGDFLSRTSYMKILSTNGKFASVENEKGLVWDIDKSILEKEAFTANQAEEVIEVNRTELINIFNKVGDAVFTVNFNKQPTWEDYAELTRNEGSKIRSFADMKKDFKAFVGDERTLIGYLLKEENGFGRSLVLDLEKKQPRQVDHRTLRWLIWKNKKYIVK